MLSLLFDTSWIYDVITTIAIVAVIIALIKFPKARVYIFSLLGIALLVFTGYSYFQLDAYYNTRGGIFGYISGVVSSNVVDIEQVEELKFKLDNIELTKEHDHSSIYSAEILTNEVMTIDSEVNYALFVNGQPLSKVEYSSDYVVADYDYLFMNAEKEVLCEDTLFIRFAFYSNSTFMSVSTSGGEEAVRFWNYYFNKNTFIVEFKESDYYSEGIMENEEILLVSYYGDNGLFKKQYALSGQRIYIPQIEDSFWKFLGWSLDGENVIDYSYFDIEENISFYAIYDDIELGTLGKAKIESDIYTTIRESIVRFPQSLHIEGVEVVSSTEETYLTTYVSILEGNPSSPVLYVVNYSGISTLKEIENAKVRMVNAGTVEDITKFISITKYLDDDNLSTVQSGIETLVGVEASEGIFVSIQESNKKGNYVATISYLVITVDEVIDGTITREGSDYNLDTYADLLIKVFGGS